jgi:hypothetical protein
MNVFLGSDARAADAIDPSEGLATPALDDVSTRFPHAAGPPLSRLDTKVEVFIQVPLRPHRSCPFCFARRTDKVRSASAGHGTTGDPSSPQRAIIASSPAVFAVMTVLDCNRQVLIGSYRYAKVRIVRQVDGPTMLMKLDMVLSSHLLGI